MIPKAGVEEEDVAAPVEATNVAMAPVEAMPPERSATTVEKLGILREPAGDPVEEAKDRGRIEAIALVERNIKEKDSLQSTIRASVTLLVLANQANECCQMGKR